MKTPWVIVSCLASLLLGAGAASWFWMDHYSSFAAQFAQMGSDARTNNAIVEKIFVLDRLRIVAL